MNSAFAFRILAAGALAAFPVKASSPAAEPPMAEWRGRTMGSPYSVRLPGGVIAGGDINELRAEVEQVLAEVNRQMSTYQPDSELSRFNRAPAQTPFPVSEEFAGVVRMALEISRRSGGAFDPTIMPVVALWGFGATSREPSVPDHDALEAARKQVGWTHLSVTPDNCLIKDIDGLMLDLGGIAKGFAVDEVGRVLDHHGFTNFYVSIAGEVLVRGHNARGSRWHLGISEPRDHWREDDPMAATVWLSGQALSTSGDYQKFYRDADGRRRSHVMDPRTGRPVEHSLAGVSVVASDSMTADALGTTLFVLGLEEGLRFVEPWTNAAALFIVRETNGRFRLVPSAQFDAMTGNAP